MKSQSPLIRSEGRVELYSISSIDLCLSIVIESSHTKSDDTFRFHHAFENSAIFVFILWWYMIINWLHYLRYRLYKFWFVGVVCFYCFYEILMWHEYIYIIGKIVWISEIRFINSIDYCCLERNEDDVFFFFIYPANAESIASAYAWGGRSQTILCCSTPFLYMMTVGNDLILWIPARYFCDSVSTFAMVTRLLSSYLSSRRGISLLKILHGPHRSAKKSTSVTQLAIVDSKSSLVRCFMNLYICININKHVDSHLK